MSDVWHVSVQNPTTNAVQVKLHSAMGLPHFGLGDATTVQVAAGAVVNVM